MYIERIDRDFGGALDAMFEILKRNFEENEYKVVDVKCLDNKQPSIKCECKCKEKKSTATDLMDDIDQVIFNDPATIVTFKDGTKVCVKACSGDKFTKETGLVYAILKRLYANDIDENGYLRSKGLGEKISRIVKNGIDQKKIEAERKAKRDAKKAKKAEAKKEAGEIVPGQE